MNTEGLSGGLNLPFLSENIRESIPLQMLLQRLHFLLSYLNSRIVGPDGVLIPRKEVHSVQNLCSLQMRSTSPLY